ncbi:MAG TPA: LL-diaminopimelate aminotransferase [Firmicutes bacterium]|nr:LL-diaminopimelate aminotransferase [Bacillota bacterium]
MGGLCPVEEAERIKNLPPYLFAEVDKAIARAKQEGKDVISFGIGDPDLPTPSYIVDRLVEEARNPENHRYPSYEGLPAFRRAVAEWYKRRFGVELDPDTEVVSLIGSKEGIAHISLCYVNPGDINLVPDPGYPVYSIGTLLAGGTSYMMPLDEKAGFLPDLDAIPVEVRRRAKLMFINYPNNPTAAVATKEFFARVVEFAREYDIVVCHDAAYSEVTFDGYKAPSFLEVPGAKEVGIEFHSLSKTYNMTGWRLGWACGSARVIEALGRVKTNIDSGVFQAIQYAGVTALTGPDEHTARACETYQKRRDMVISGFNSLGWDIKPTKGTFYIWAPVPPGFTSIAFSNYVLEKAAVFLTPGIGYGQHGEGYFRISLTTPDHRIQEALERLKKAGIRFDRAR